LQMLLNAAGLSTFATKLTTKSSFYASLWPNLHE
jgi:hypothetical protein